MRRRTFLQVAGHGALYGSLAFSLAQEASALTPAQIAGDDADLHLLRRISFGPTLQELERLRRIGRAAYVQEQLDATDPQTEVLAATLYPLINASGTAIFVSAAAGLAIEPHIAALQSAMLYRALFSSAQLREVMVDFWNDHFNTYIRRNPIPLKLDFDREVIRPNALGNFKALLKATVRSAEMLHYLDNWTNTRDSVNENYARELLELHTLGRGGFEEADMKALARILTGLGYVTDLPQALVAYGRVEFRPALHDQTGKVFLGEVFPEGGGEEEIDRALQLVCDHPATALHIATKLCRRFVADEPSTALVGRIAGVFTASDGDIRAMVEAILGSAEFGASTGEKLKRPTETMVGALRACGLNRFDQLLNAELFGAPVAGSTGLLFQGLAAAGHAPFAWVHPDGYPDRSSYWGNANALLYQQKFLVRLVEGLAFGRILSNPLDFLIGGMTVAAAVADARTPREAVVHASGNLLFGRLPPSAEVAAVAFMAQDADPDAPMDTALLEQRSRGLVFALLSSPWFLLR